MGTGFTVDTPLRVARFGISSVVALGDDTLLEQMRKYHMEALGLPYERIHPKSDDARARRVTAYLDFLGDEVAKQVKVLQALPFEPESEITRYFEMLPNCPLKSDYYDMLATTDPVERARKQDALRPRAVPGSVDVNIMAKADADVFKGKEKLPPEYALAMAAMRGYAASKHDSSIVLSAGMNPRLYGLMGRLEPFFPTAEGRLRKKIILKVSDYRSAEIQGKYLAKKGLWVSEYRIESGLNCGGHAFASDGYLLGPILEEFRQNRQALIETAFALYVKGLAAHGECPIPDEPFPQRITVQGGIGTADENEFLLKYYRLDGTGWGTPFLLVPETTNVDDSHLEKLAAATEKDVYLSDSSPFGVPFWTLRHSASEEGKRQRIASGKPGSPCTRGLLKLNNEYGEQSLCMASRAYLKRKIADLRGGTHTPEQLAALEETALARACICLDLAGGATVKHGIDPKAEPAICCGPNIAYFSRTYSLEEMVNHIYGRIDLLANTVRPHMFINELRLYLDYMRKEMNKVSLEISSRSPKYFAEFKANLRNGIDYYAGIAKEFAETQRERFLNDLDALAAELETIAVPAG